MIDWPGRWAKKTIRLNATNMDWEHFRRDPILMEGIQTVHGNYNNMYQRCKKYQVPLWLMADDQTIGNPKGCYVSDTFLTASSMKHASHIHRIRTNWTPPKIPIRVLEIGGGYGGLLTTILQCYKVTSYTVIDSEPMHRIRSEYLAQWLQKNPVAEFSHVSLSMDDIEPDAAIDLAIASNALVEMPAEAVTKYFDMLHKCIVPGGAFYTANSKKHEIKPTDFPWDDKWKFRIDGPAFGEDRYSEILAIRSK